MSSVPIPHLSPEEYLAIERGAEYKSEYHNGRMFAMSGGSLRHNGIAVEFAYLLRTHFRKSDCSVFVNDVRLHVAAVGLYTYPDLMVVCGNPQTLDACDDTLLNPVLLAEILSPSTERYDRVAKIAMYHTIPSLRECLLITQDAYRVEISRREADGRWRVNEVTGRDAVIELTSVGYTLKLAELYETAKL